MLICQVIELAPTEAQRRVFCRNANAARIARNDLIAQWREEGKRLPAPGFRYSLSELRPVLNGRKYEAHPWFREVSQNAVKGGYIDAEDAVKRFYSGQNRRPKFHGENRCRRFRADNGVDTVKLRGKCLLLPKLCGGRVKTKENLRWDCRPIRECRIKESAGRWYASVGVEITQEEYGKVCGSGVAGGDLGLRVFLTVLHDDGSVEKVHAPEPLRRSLTTLRRRQREVSRRKPGGKNREKSKLKVQKAHVRVANIRKDFLHKLSDRLASGSEYLVLEDLTLAGWKKLWGRKTSDLSPGEFVRKCGYKFRWGGGEVLYASRDYASTQICSGCGQRGGKLDLSVVFWVCGVCGAEHDRDGNAALNLQGYGRELLGVSPRSPCETSSVEAVGVEVGTEIESVDFSTFV